MNKNQSIQIDSQRIPREEYLERLRNLKHKKLIKIVTGIRRCGKSTVLEMFRDELLDNGVEENQIIFINFELFLLFSHVLRRITMIYDIFHFLPISIIVIMQ